MTELPFPLTPVEGAARLPESAEVVVIGGGILGVLSALELAEAGVSVVLLEKGVIAGEQSSRNWGWVRQMGRVEAELPLAKAALEMWRGMDRRIGGVTGFRQTGIAYTAFTDADARHWRHWHAIGTRHGIPTQMLGPEESRARFPGLAEGVKLSLWSPQDGCAEPWQAVPAMAEAAKRRGVTILTHCAARKLDSVGGVIRGVYTERGHIATTKVLVAAGAWTRTFLRAHGLTFVALAVRGTVARVEGVPDLPDHPLGTEGFSFRPRRDGGQTLTLRNANEAWLAPDNFRFLPRYLGQLRHNWREFHLRLGPDFLAALRRPSDWSAQSRTVFEEVRVLNLPPSQYFLRLSLERARAAFPQFAAARLTHSWSGVMDITPDSVPVIDRLPGLEGGFVASGASGHGFGLGPGLARLASDLMLGRPPVVDPQPFSWTRKPV